MPISCDNPRAIFNKTLKKGMLVRCGKCESCHSFRASQWQQRINEEARVGKNYFLTLTYSDENLKYLSGDINNTPVLCLNDLQNFLKRFRINYKRTTGQNSSLKYFACGEYGEKYKRPHYHLIMMNTKLEKEAFVNFINLSWVNGFIHVGDVTIQSIKYVTNYIKGQVTSDGSVREFNKQSKNLGRDYVEKNKEYYASSKSVQYRRFGDVAPLSRYYRDKIFTKEQKEEIMQPYIEEMHRESLKTARQIIDERKLRLHSKEVLKSFKRKRV